MTIDADTEAIEAQLRVLNTQISEIVTLLKEQAGLAPKAEDAPASATEKHDNPPEEQ